MLLCTCMPPCAVGSTSTILCTLQKVLPAYTERSSADRSAVVARHTWSSSIQADVDLVNFEEESTAYCILCLLRTRHGVDTIGICHDFVSRVLTDSYQQDKAAKMTKECTKLTPRHDLNAGVSGITS